MKMVSRLKVNLGILLLAAAGFVLYIVSLPPVGLSICGFFSLVPWIIANCKTGDKLHFWLINYVFGVIFWGILCWWIAPITIQGYISMCLYLGIFWALLGWLVRILYRQMYSSEGGGYVCKEGIYKWVYRLYEHKSSFIKGVSREASPSDNKATCSKDKGLFAKDEKDEKKEKKRAKGICIEGLPFWILTGLAIVSVEYLRSLGPLGFAWFFLAHTQAENPYLIQIADLGGVYTVSALLGLVNGIVADIILGYKHLGKRGCILRLLIAAGLIGSSLMYSQFRLREYDRLKENGPRIAVIQTDIPLRVDSELPSVSSILEELLSLSRFAAASSPDVIVWPETAIPVSINREFLEAELEDRVLKMEQELGIYTAKIIEKYARKFSSQIIVGSISKIVNPPDYYPRVERFNSAIVYGKDGSYLGRYDKIMLVLFGEYVPFRYTFPWLYRFLNDFMTPYGRGGFEYSLSRGDSLDVFTVKGSALSSKAESKGRERDFKYSVIICYEGTLPDFVRKFIIDDKGKKRIDFLVNISNDGWFGYSAEHIQHFQNCIFRAIENRVPIARSVNTGVSGFIDSMGRSFNLIRGPERLVGPDVKGFSVADVLVDRRITIYSRLGNLPWKVVVGFLFAYVILSVVYRRRLFNAL